MTTMFSGTNNALSTEVYDAALIYWSSLTVQSGINAHFDNATYSAGAATTARGILTTTYNWNITDGGQAAYYRSGFMSDGSVLYLLTDVVSGTINTWGD